MLDRQRPEIGTPGSISDRGSHRDPTRFCLALPKAAKTATVLPYHRIPSCALLLQPYARIPAILCYSCAAMHAIPGQSALAANCRLLRPKLPVCLAALLWIYPGPISQTLRIPLHVRSETRVQLLEFCPFVRPLLRPSYSSEAFMHGLAVKIWWHFC